MNLLNYFLRLNYYILLQKVNKSGRDIKNRLQMYTQNSKNQNSYFQSTQSNRFKDNSDFSNFSQANTNLNSSFQPQSTKKLYDKSNDSFGRQQQQQQYPRSTQYKNLDKLDQLNQKYDQRNMVAAAINARQRQQGTGFGAKIPTDPKNFSKASLARLISQYIRLNSPSEQFKTSFNSIISSFYTKKIILNMLLMNYLVGLLIARRSNWFKLTSTTFRTGVMGFGFYYISSMPAQLSFSKKMDKFIDENRLIVEEIILQAKFKAQIGSVDQ